MSASAAIGISRHAMVALPRGELDVLGALFENMRVLEERLMKEIVLPHRQIQSTLRRAATAMEPLGSKPKGNHGA
jgi:hypothetical protein